MTNGKVTELGKIPALITHFREHKSQQAELSFNEFLFMHYVGDDANSQDNSSDEQLPFKDSGENSEVPIDGIWLPDNEIVFSNCIEKIGKHPVPVYRQDVLMNFHNPLFRPPVLA